MLRVVSALFVSDLQRIKKTPLVYLLGSGYLLISGFFFFSLLKAFNPIQRMLSEDVDINLNFNSGVIQPLLETQSVILLFIIPFVTMRSFAEEKQLGSLALMLTTPVSTLSLVLSKFLSNFLIVMLAVVLGFIFPLGIYVFGDPEVGPIITGVLGLMLYSASIVSMGILISILSPSQTIAGVFTIIAGIMWLLLDLPFVSLSGQFFDLVKDLALSQRINGFTKGVVYFSDIFFFVALTVLFLNLSMQSLSIWREE